MTEAFYSKILEIIGQFLFFLISIIGLTIFLISWLMTGMQIFYTAWLTSMACSLLFFIWFYFNFKQLTEKVSLYFPKAIGDSTEPPMQDKVLSDNDALNACIYYEQGASLNDIRDSLGLDHPTQVKRLLRKGLKILIMNYRKNEETEVTAN